MSAHNNRLSDLIIIFPRLFVIIVCCGDANKRENIWQNCFFVTFLCAHFPVHYEKTLKNKDEIRQRRGGPHLYFCEVKFTYTYAFLLPQPSSYALRWASRSALSCGARTKYRT